MKNTLRVLWFDVVTELFFPSWSHSCYTLTVFLESYSDESLPSFSPSSFALSPAVSPSSLLGPSLAPATVPSPPPPHTPHPRSGPPPGPTARGAGARAGPEQGQPCPPSGVGGRRPAGERGRRWARLRGDPGPDSSLTSLESGGRLKLGDAPGPLKMVAFSGRSRVPPGEARAPVKERGGPGPGLRGGLGVGLGAGGEGPRERAREATPEPGGTGSLSARRAHKCTSLFPGPCSAAALAEMSSRCSQPPSPPRVPQGAAPASAKSAVGPSPFPRWVRGSFLSSRSRSSSPPKLLRLFPREAQRGQGTLLPGNTGLAPESVTFLRICAAPRHYTALHPAFLDPSCEVCFLPLAPRPLGCSLNPQNSG